MIHFFVNLKPVLLNSIESTRIGFIPIKVYTPQHKDHFTHISLMASILHCALLCYILWDKCQVSNHSQK